MHQTSNIKHQTSVVSYAIGFLLSIIFTFTAYYFVEMHVISDHVVYSHGFLTAFVLTLAFAQFIVQLFLFLHLGRESGPRWKLLIFVATFLLMLVVVLGSLWIMNHLNASMMPNMDNSAAYLVNQSG